MDATNEGNSFHFGVNFEEALEDEAASSQELGEEDLNNIVKESNLESTTKCTTWGLKRFFRWAEKKNKYVDLKTISLEQLNTTLRQFYAEVKTEKKGMLTASALTWNTSFNSNNAVLFERYRYLWPLFFIYVTLVSFTLASTPRA